jgi:hypothetical protein
MQRSLGCRYSCEKRVASMTLTKGSIMKDRAMNGAAWSVLPFPSASSSAIRRAQRKDLLNALRVCESPVLLDFSGCRSLSFEDIDLLLECMAQVAGRDTQVVFVAGSSATRVLLEVTRISSLAPVFNSIEEVLAHPQMAAERDFEDRAKDHQGANQSQTLWSA